MRTRIFFILILIKGGDCLEFPCSDEYSADFQLYGSCITQNCGRHLIQLSNQDIELVDKIAENVYQQDKTNKNATVLTLDLASNQLMVDGVSSQFQFKDKSQLEALTDLLIDTIGQNIRSKTKKLFRIQAKLYISSPILLTWINSNSTKDAPNYTDFHVDQLTQADSTSFHYTAVIYLDNESQEFHGGHLEFEGGFQIKPRRGLAVIFTSGEENVHRVTPVTKGLRRAMTIFLTCDKAFSVMNSKLYQ